MHCSCLLCSSHATTSAECAETQCATGATLKPLPCLSVCAGAWSAEESKLLQELVTSYIATTKKLTKAVGEGDKEDGRTVLDDVDWVYVAERMGTRNSRQCMNHWYAPCMILQAGTSLGTLVRA